MEVRGSVMWVLLICYIFGHITTSHHRNGFVEAKRLDKFEDLEIEKKLRTINKPAVKIIKTIHGERYGCVDFFKQPAFDHPSMKNHTYHYKMRPKSHPHLRKGETNNTGFGYLWKNGVGCPIGTVPIRRITKEDILGMNLLEAQHKPRGSWNTTTYHPNNPVHYDLHHYAVSQTTKKGMVFNGATMELCVTAPKVKPTQFSSSRLHIQIGDDFIEIGITVNPVLYKDNQPRVFVYTKAGSKSCYNHQCDVGIISVRHDFPIGLVVEPVSNRGAQRSFYQTFGLIKDKVNGNWWFHFGSEGDAVGYWPSNRFCQSSGNLVEWGGEVYTASLPGPEMGYGLYPVIDIRYDAYIKRISILDGDYQFDSNVDYIQSFSDDNRRYQVVDLVKSEFRDAGHVIFYGGPGNY